MLVATKGSSHADVALMDDMRDGLEADGKADDEQTEDDSHDAMLRWCGRARRCFVAAMIVLLLLIDAAAALHSLFAVYSLSPPFILVLLLLLLLLLLLPRPSPQADPPIQMQSYINSTKTLL